jgi:hypothetical protein
MLILPLLAYLVPAAFYGPVVFMVARKQGINPWPWTIAALIPYLGILLAGIFLLLTLLSVLDRLNALEDARR